ncbi:DNA-protecting protein DprA [Alsobacter soli]|uniref:DNA-protecting protein DprA n=1 Tax=Alsobacter soli TaxID=2109933 RepID=A0A2T1HMC6_9HYPH|nr:DNA-processing protein DprA [Alsobacter soli]PSC02803.1 DNA-protecting protein DprA [Alsobacter soli]
MSLDAGRPVPGLTDAQRFDWLRLIRSENIGPRTFRALINHFGGAGAALEGLPDYIRSRGGKPIRICPVADAEREWEAARRMGVRFIASGEVDYPAALRAIDSAPPLIAVRGQFPALHRPCVAVVGSRNASANGQQIAIKMSRELAAAGFTVVSGLARGIDARAHEVTMDSGTAAVLAGGHDRLYPAEHAPLLERILERGAVVSEMPMGWEPRGRDFPRRNRIVSGLSLGVLVVEAARKSGSLITARFALEQGREVFAVPGSPLDPRAAGTNDLLRQGATFTTSAEDVIAALQPLIEQGPGAGAIRDTGQDGAAQEPLWDELDLFGDVPPPPTVAVEGYAFEEAAASVDAAHPGSDDRDATIVVGNLLGPAPIGLDDLVRSSGLTVGAVRSALIDLEVAGRIERHGAGLVSLRPGPAERGSERPA